MSVKSFSEKFKKAQPQYEDLDDSDIINMVTKKDPEMIGVIDRDDLAKTVRQNQAKQISKARQKQFNSLSTYSQGMGGVGQGMMDIYAGVKQMFGGDTQDYQADKEAWMDASKGNLTAGIGEVVGNIAATAPLGMGIGSGLAKVGGLASKLIPTAIAEGTAIGATELVDEGESRLGNTAYGALFGAGGAGAGLLLKKLGSKGFNALKGKYKDANAEELMALSKQYDVPLSLGDVTGKGSKTEILSENIPFGMNKFREKGSEKVTKAVDDFVGESQDDWTKTVQESMKNKSKAVKEKATGLYNKVEKLSGGAKVNPAQSISKINKIEKEVGKTLTPGNDSFGSYLSKTKEAMESGKANYSSLRATRQDLGNEAKKYADTDPNRSRLLMGLRDAIEVDMDKAIGAQVESMTKRVGNKMQKLAGGEGAYTPFKKSEMAKETVKQTKKGEQLKKAYKEATEFYKKEAVPFKDRSIKSAIKSNKPDEIYKSFMQEGGGDRAKIFYNALDEKGRDAVKYGIIKKAYTKANTTTAQGDVISPAKFASYLDKMDVPKNIFFKGKAKKELDGFRKLMKASTRYGQYMENPPTGNRMAQISGIAGSGLSSGALPLGTAGAKFFWTGPGKKFLLAASELDNEGLEKLLTKILKQLPRASVATGKQIKE